MAARSFWDYIKAAFSAKPKGMFVAPNWIGLGAVGVLGFLNPGIWIIGAGVEAWYLLTCASSKRFRKAIDATSAAAESAVARGEVNQNLQSLPNEERQRYTRLVKKCQDILRSLPKTDVASTASDQARGLAHLAWIYLNLLSARHVISRHLDEVAAEEESEGTLEARLAKVARDLQREGLSEELQRSLAGRKQILEERMQRQKESVEKLQFTEAELQRIEDQVQLMRDQAALQSDPATISGSIDRVAEDLQEASSWIREQRRVYRDLGDVLEEPPPASILAAE